MTNLPEKVSFESHEIVPLSTEHAESHREQAHNTIQHLNANESALLGLYNRTENILKTLIEKDPSQHSDLLEMEKQLDALLKEYKQRNTELQRKVSVAEARFDEGEDIKVDPTEMAAEIDTLTNESLKEKKAAREENLDIAKFQSGDYIDIEAELTPAEFAAAIKAKEKSAKKATPKKKAAPKERKPAAPRTRKVSTKKTAPSSEEVFDKEHGTNEDTRWSALLTPLAESEAPINTPPAKEKVPSKLAEKINAAADLVVLQDFNLGDGTKKTSEVPWDDAPPKRKKTPRESADTFVAYGDDYASTGASYNEMPQKEREAQTRERVILDALTKRNVEAINFNDGEVKSILTGILLDFDTAYHHNLDTAMREKRTTDPRTVADIAMVNSMGMLEDKGVNFELMHAATQNYGIAEDFFPNTKADYSSYAQAAAKKRKTQSPAKEKEPGFIARFFNRLLGK